MENLSGTDVKSEIAKCYESFIEAFNNGNAKGVAMNYAEFNTPFL